MEQLLVELPKHPIMLEQLKYLPAHVLGIRASGEVTTANMYNVLLPALDKLHFTRWRRIAVVTSQKAVEIFTDVFELGVPGNSKGFRLGQLDEAKIWVGQHGKIDLFNIAQFAAQSFLKLFCKHRKSLIFNIAFTNIAELAVLLTDFKSES